ncbi:arylsulfatase [Bacteroidota bacterium]
MRSRKAKNISIVLTGIIITGTFLTLLLSCSPEPDTPPNIIIVITDDQGYGELGAHGNSIIHTPNLDDFYNEAVRFTNFHVGTTCAPTRAGVLTARNCNRNGVWHTIGGCSLLNVREETVADVFSASGYATGMFGKWHLGDTYPFRPEDRGFVEAFYHGGGGIGQTPDYWQNDYFDDTYFRNGVPEKAQGYCTDVWFDEALNFIERHRAVPFFCYLSTNAPHGPYNLPESYLEPYMDAELMPHQKRFYGMISNIDDNFGMLLEKLDEWGLADNTIVIFMTDNGTAAGIARDRESGRVFGFNAGMRGTKGSQYDGGHRVPLFIRWTGGGLKAGTDIEELAAHVDLLPTLAELCSVKFNPVLNLDGISLAGLLKEGKSLPERMLVTDTQRQQWPEKNRNSCVMDSEWRLVNGTELYNIKEDPGQKNDLSLEYPDRVQKMAEFYNNCWSEIESEFEYSHIKIGSDDQNPVIITCHDMHTEDPVPWHQGYIREGLLSPDGYYSIEVVEPGEYEIRMKRWPFESGLNMEDDINGMEGNAYTDAIPTGKGMSFNSARFEIVDGMVITEKVNDSGTAILTQLKAGQYKMKFNFQDESGTDFPAYYISISKI